jgi:hypothetical protein
VEFQLRTRFPWPKVLGWLLALAILLAVKPHFHFCHLRRGEKIYPIGVTTRSLFAGWAGLTVGLGGPAAEVAVTDQEGVPITRLRAGWLLRTSAQRLDGSWESIRSGASVPGRDDGLVFVRGWEPRPKAKPSDGTGVEAEPAPPELPDY